MNCIGPNTNASPELIQQDCVLIVGEDAATTEPLLAGTFGTVEASHSFRSYVFGRRASLTTIFSGIGTGCLEPLLWELASCGRVKRILLIGTAGLLPQSRARVGRAYVIGEARSMGTGIDAVGIRGPFRPRFPLPKAIETATVVSTDFYYGFSAGVLNAHHPLAGSDLPELFRRASEDDLVDMEVAQFYALCGLFMPKRVQFAAIKSPSNPAGEGETHLANTPSALAAAAQLACTLLSPPTKRIARRLARRATL